MAGGLASRAGSAAYWDGIAPADDPAGGDLSDRLDPAAEISADHVSFLKQMPRSLALVLVPGWAQRHTRPVERMTSTPGQQIGARRFVSIATQASSGHAPIQIRAEILRRGDAFMPFGIRGGGTMIHGEAADPPAGIDRRGSGWRQSDVKRAIGAAEQSGLTAYRVEIATDGTIAIVVGMEADAGAEVVAEKRSS